LKATFTVIVWGGSFVATKVAIKEVSPIPLVWIRFGIGVVLLAAVVGLRGQLAWPKRKDLAYFALLGFLGIAFHQWLQSTGLQTSKATTTSWIVATIPVLTALLGWFILRERPGWIKILGILLASLGVLLVVSNGNLASLAGGGALRPGDYLILLSAPNWAVFSVLSRKGLQEHPPARMMLYVMLSGWLLTGIPFAAAGSSSELAGISLNGWLALVFLGVLCSGLAYIFWYDALQVLPVSELSAFIYLEPLVTLILAALLLGEPVTWPSVVGGGVILAGVWLVQASLPNRTLPRVIVESGK
jgi:drug/metabolite transporter (DMT)-like permease